MQINKILPIMFMVCLTFLLFQCGNNANAKSSGNGEEAVVIFGRKDCGHCLDFMAELDKEGIKYNFNNLVDNKANEDAMYAKVKQFEYAESLNLPVVIVNDKHFYCQPTLTEVVAALGDVRE